MKLQPDKSSAPTISAYGQGWIEVNGERHSQSLMVSSLPGTPPAPWAAGPFESLCADDFSFLATHGAELVLFGSGQKLRFAKPQWLQALISQGIGVETMDTSAACRTYNILASEGRKVVALLLMES
ncbi:hypothetical protein B9Z47_11985 [Limnohabitans sp. 2KL-1]|jgi:uncharacterized protein|uniref:Mth938-like domain-containing protein n=1 Tax=Limnohabitans sp. 2KL-1 TaxID=1100699 RepID=UPI000D35427B|nr:Mth938-like domain-containing protein [Limnohabitans sp. 2KL-1]PUE47024.1 hypothetical protein B9Z47_11985 [Limnohabitans sp. 2KL-1]